MENLRFKAQEAKGKGLHPCCLLLMAYSFTILFLFQSSAQTTNIKELDQRGDCLLRDKKYEEAIGVWQQALDKDPRHVDTLLRIGIALSLMEKYQQAHTTLSYALEVEPDNPKVLYNLGLLFLRQSQDDKALEYLERTLKIVDWYPEANYHVGLIYERKGLKEKALGLYVKEINNNSASAKTWQRIFMLKKQSKSKKLPPKTGVLIIGVLLAIAGVLFLRKLSTDYTD